MFYCALDAQFRTCAFLLERFHLSAVRALRHNDRFLPIRGPEPLAVVALCVAYNLGEHLDLACLFHLIYCRDLSLYA